MEQEKPEADSLRSELKSISQMTSKFVSVLLSIITGCVMLMVGFIWNLKSDFATEKQQMVQAVKDIEDIKGDIKTSRSNVQTLNETVIRLDQRITNLEEKLRKN